MRRSIALLGLSGLLPITVLSSGFALSSLYSERQALTRRAEILSDFSATIVERELNAQMRQIQMVAQSPLFDHDLDRDRFHVLARRLTQEDPRWTTISVSSPEGLRILDSPSVIGGTLGGQVVDQESLDRAVRLKTPVVGNIVIGPRGRSAFAVRAPVLREGEVAYIVSAIIPTTGLQDLIMRPMLPEEWRVIMLDRNGREATYVGVPPQKQVRSFRTSLPDTGWTIAVEVPDRSFARLNRQVQAVLVIGVGFAMLLFIGFGWLLYRHLQSLRESEAAATHAHKLEALGRLTGGVAHDLNNLLTPIMGGLDLLKRRVATDEKALRYIENASLSAERARRLVARLLTFSRQQPLSTEVIALAALFEDLKDLLLQALGPSHTLNLELEPEIPDIQADRDQLELTIMNLVINARDATPHGGEVIVQGRRASRAEAAALPSADYLAISIIDSGIGMDAATLQRAQEPFFSTKPLGQGTGLGLSMAYGFAKQSGGAIVLSSKPGAGTTATIILPAFQAEQPKEASEASQRR